MNLHYCIGVDFGTDSVRALVVNTRNGQEMASSVSPYIRWQQGLFCKPAGSQFRQHPHDYLDGLENVLRECLAQAGPSVRKNIKAISMATTGSTPVLVDQKGMPLAMHPSWAKEPDAMFILWKDHSAVKEAEEINRHSRQYDGDYLKNVGGIYSSEWYWSKLLYLLRRNEALCAAAAGFVEHTDWMPFVLTGGNDIQALKRGVCTAGHKALWSKEWFGFPPAGFFAGLDPRLARFAEGLSNQVYAADKRAGNLSPEWAARLGLSTKVLVGIGAMDAHMAAVGGQIEPGQLSKVMGTSTCDMMVVRTDKLRGRQVQGICGQVNGSIIPGMTGMEAGQSAFGDVYAWFVNLLAWPLKNLTDIKNSPVLQEMLTQKMIPELLRQAAELPADEDSELSVDWFNGRRTPDANALLKACITGLNLGTDAPRLFRSLVEATCFGARAIVERFEEQGIAISGLTGIGGIARKSPYIMQLLADITGLPVRINRSEQTCALGAAMFATVYAGIYPSVKEAMQSMGQGFDLHYEPDPAKAAFYEQRYRRYRAAGDFMEQQTNHYDHEFAIEG
jgi:L-ribulokinase